MVRHQLATNDPNTYYRLTPKLAELLAGPAGEKRDRLLRDLQLGGRKASARPKLAHGTVEVAIAEGRSFRLSPGPHNELERLAVELLGPSVLVSPKVV